MKRSCSRNTGLQLAIDAVGSRKALAHLAGVSPQAISQWKKIPVGRCAELERATGISRRQLRPDVFAGMSNGYTEPEQQGPT